MMKTNRIGLLLALIAWIGGAEAADSALPEDPREAVEMPALQRALLREDMVQHMAAFNEVFGLVNEGKLKEAADLAETGLGFSSMGKHAARTQGQGPGRFMPEGMRATAIGMHKAASEFAEVAKQGDRAAAYKALEPVMGACVACHAGYRLK